MRPPTPRSGRLSAATCTRWPSALATIGNTPAFWPVLADQSPDPYQHAEARDLLEALREEIGRLTPRQRQVFVAIALSEVPIDVLADRLNTTRGALYKMLHDARHHLKAVLAARGLGSAGEWR